MAANAESAEVLDAICDKESQSIYGVPYSFLTDAQKVNLTKNIAIAYAIEQVGSLTTE